MSERTQNFPTKEQIERRAYEIYLQRGGADGSDVADWILAEEELMMASKVTVAKPIVQRHASQEARRA